MARKLPPTVPTESQLVPFHLARTPPDVPAYISLPDTVSARTVAPALTPDPIADHDAPFHMATRGTETPPAVLNIPPAYTSVPETASDSTVRSIPVPMLTHDVPFQRAMLFRDPASVKWPPASTFVPDTAIALTKSLPRVPRPDPIADHALPSHLATFLAGTPPADANWPAT